MSHEKKSKRVGENTTGKRLPMDALPVVNADTPIEKPAVESSMA
jgi:hypothetical protein